MALGGIAQIRNTGMKFKNKKDQELFFALHPILILIVADMNLYASQNFDTSLTITDTISTKEQDERLGRRSTSHQRGVACDIRTRDLTPNQIDELKDYINSKEEYEDYKYLSFSGEKRLAYFHDNGNGAHFHVQIHSRYSIRR